MSQHSQAASKMSSWELWPCMLCPYLQMPTGPSMPFDYLCSHYSWDWGILWTQFFFSFEYLIFILWDVVKAYNVSWQPPPPPSSSYSPRHFSNTPPFTFMPSSFLFCNPLSPISAACWNIDWSCWLDPVQTTMTALSSWVHWPCRVQKTAFHCSLPRPPALAFFPPQCSLSLCWGGVIKTSHWGLSTPWLAILGILTNYESLQWASFSCAQSIIALMEIVLFYLLIYSLIH